MPRLFTLNQLKPVLGIAGLSSIQVDQEENITRILNGVISKVETFTGRVLDYGTQTEILVPYSSRNSSFFSLKRFPISSVTSITPMESGVFDEENILDESTYFMLSEEGTIKKVSGWWRDIPYQITYIGGYLDYQETDEYLSANHSLPDDLAYAIMDQAVFEYNRRNELGLSGQSSGDSSIPFLPQKHGFVPATHAVFDKYKANRI